MSIIEELKTRRRFLKTLAGGIIAPLAGGALLTRTATVIAADNPHLKEDDPAAKQLNYKHDASQVDSSKYESGQKCDNCRYFKGNEGDEWGPCTIFPGKSVNGAGWCSSYSAK
ncbi:MAG: high-potential iron-sulfur protein [Marinobacter sp.]|nr:high-potential iron-sulfur protein [Marinobacter sp.]